MGVYVADILLLDLISVMEMDSCDTGSISFSDIANKHVPPGRMYYTQSEMQKVRLSCSDGVCPGIKKWFLTYSMITQSGHSRLISQRKTASDSARSNYRNWMVLNNHFIVSIKLVEFADPLLAGAAGEELLNKEKL